MRDGLSKLRGKNLMLEPNPQAINDAEGDTIPKEFPGVVDAHVHIFPKNIFSAIRQWFDDNAWNIRYRVATSQVFEFLLSHGIAHVIALQYAHKPGIARNLNQYMVQKCREFPGQVTGMATVFPGEDNAGGVLKEAFDAGLKGVKLHAHVQCFDMNSDDIYRIYEVCESEKKPMIMHVGREPKSEAYRCDPYQICRADKLERVLIDFPYLKICVPHLGINELTAYRNLIEKYDTLWLDTTMVLADYFPIDQPIDLGRYRTDRIMYGSDFPNIPYAWDRELKKLSALRLSDNALEWILHKSASNFFDLKMIIKA